MRYKAGILGSFSSADFRRLNGLGAVVKNSVRKASDDTFFPKMNKTETMYYDEFLRNGDGREFVVIAQPTRFFRLPGGGTYTPDFLVVKDGALTAVEVKGSRAYIGYEQGIDRYNRCAEHFHRFGISFRLCEFSRKRNAWTTTVYE